MRFITLALFLTMIPSNMQCLTYNELREEFKLTLYNCQWGLMSSKKQYFSFLEPFIKQAESELAIIKFCMNNPDAKWSSAYFDSLVEYNICCFGDYIKYPNSKKRLQHASDHLLSVINEIKDTSLKHIDSDKEFSLTKSLFYKANMAYYKKLGTKIKLLLWYSKHFHCIH